MCRELDEEINRSKTRGATTALPHLGDLGPPEVTGAAAAEPAPEEGEAPEESSSEEEENVGFWEPDGKKAKKGKEKKDGKSSKKEKSKREKANKDAKIRRRRPRRTRRKRRRPVHLPAALHLLRIRRPQFFG